MGNNYDKIEFIQWLIQRYDTMRYSIANRAAILLSGNALLFAGITFLMDKAFFSESADTIISQIALCISIIFCYYFLIRSIYSAINAITFLKPVESILESEYPYKKFSKRMIFHHRDIVEMENFDMVNKQKKLEEKGEFFKRFYLNLEKEDILDFAINEIYIAAHTHKLRYTYFRDSMKYLIFALIPFLVSIIFMLILKIYIIKA